MIIWLNGAFGAGKTQTAFELHRRIPGSFVYDPEEAGFFIRSNIPDTLKTPDFQDYPLWREINFRMLLDMDSRFDGNIICPMTITNKSYFDEIIGQLRQCRCDVRHFILWANAATLEKRLASRLEGKNSWAYQQIPRCLAAFESSITEGIIDTRELTVSQTAEKIASLCSIELLPDERSTARKKLDSIATQIKHVR
ncbi:MAG: tunicamycin resistance protein [Ruminococcaceae bacterium]|nr:tunicamycin resistance protein [Oscillospiraceae bacterium]